jgi:uncharacterized protein with HEPN domain
MVNTVNYIGWAIARRVMQDIRDNHPEIILTTRNLNTIHNVVCDHAAKVLHELVWDEPVRDAIVASAARQGITIRTDRLA